MKKNNLLTAVIMVLFIAACSSNNSQKQSNQVDEKNQASSFEEFNSEWQTMKPELDELIAMKQELQALITELNKLADTPTPQVEKSPAMAQSTTAQSNIEPNVQLSSGIVTPAPKVEPQIVQVNKEEIEPLVTQEDVNTKKGFSIQLGSFSKVSRLKTVWASLQKQYPELLKQKTALSEKTITSTNSTFYRLKAITFSQEAANNACRDLKSKNQNCMVSNIKGINL